MKRLHARLLSQDEEEESSGYDQYPLFLDPDDRALWERQYDVGDDEIEQERSERRAQEASEIDPAYLCHKCKVNLSVGGSEYCDNCLCVDCPSDDRQVIKYIKARLCTRCNEYRRMHKGQPRPPDTKRGRK